jgi:predicted transcriptional regulator
MNLNESTLQTEKIQAVILETLQTLRKEEGYKFIEMTDMGYYTALKGLVSEGYLDKNGMQFKITEKGLGLLEALETYIERTRMQVTESTVIDLKEMATFTEEYNNRDVIKVEYMRESLNQSGVIESAVVEFEKDANDGLPIIPVTEEAYKGLIDRAPGQHWRRYVGEAGRKLIRDKKLEKVYIMNETTERRYLYEVPKK